MFKIDIMQNTGVTKYVPFYDLLVWRLYPLPAPIFLLNNVDILI